MFRVLAILVVMTTTPCALEIIETVAHLVTDGDYVHTADVRHGQPQDEDAEHGCTPLQHHCGCHASSVSTVSIVTTLKLDPRTPSTDHRMGTYGEMSGRDTDPPPVPPPNQLISSFV